MLRSLAVCILLLIASPSHAQNWEAYQPARIDTVISQYKTAIDQAGDSYSRTPGFHMWPAMRYSRIRVRAAYTGEQRPVRADRERLISAWLKARGADSTYVDLYETEVQFQTDSGAYWLPMQSKPLSYLSREVAEGEHVQLYVTFMGAYASSSDPLSWVFCVNEYQTASE